MLKISWGLEGFIFLNISNFGNNNQIWSYVIQEESKDDIDVLSLKCEKINIVTKIPRVSMYSTVLNVYFQMSFSYSLGYKFSPQGEVSNSR